jgi:hypothetical protein
MERWLTDGDSPEIKLKSGFDYELPDDYSEMLNNLNMIDEAYQESIFHGINQHCYEQHAGSGFYPISLIPPNLQD